MRPALRAVLLRVSAAIAAAYTDYDWDGATVAAGADVVFNVTVGPAHPNRVIVLAWWNGGSVAPSACKINGSPATLATGGVSMSIYYLAVPTGGPNFEVRLTIGAGTGSGRASVDVWTIYPASSTPVDAGLASASTTAPAVVSDVAIAAGGYLIWFAGTNANAINFTTTWTGADAVVEDSGPKVLEAVSSTETGHIVCTETNTTFDLSAAVSATCLKSLLTASWGAPA